jgi:hypothetical protein
MIPRLQSFRPSVALAAILGIAIGMLVVSGIEAQQVSPDTKPEDLAEGEFVWEPEAAPDGPIVVLVSLNQQRAYVYRNGVLIGYTNVSTGKPGHETPTGVFTILQKDKDHVSSIYKAKMPYTERLTWSGICLHAGGLPGYPSSHGCIHLPLEFSQLLYDIEHLGATVVIADEHSGPEEAAHPAILLSPMMHEQRKEGPAAGIAKFEWEPERSTEGPLSLLLSSADSKLFVYRNGVEIGFAEIHLTDPGQPLPAGVHTVLDGFSDKESSFAPGHKMHRWMSVSTEAGSAPVEEDDSALAARIHIPPFFVSQIYDALVPGTTLMITNRPATPETKSDSDFVIMATHPAEETSD